ncbi:MAG: hypothetical protein M3Y53_01175 [Thermoproteota archaeon]|nr:hypothetical protein [Thermoproteota archaeon]
MKKTALGIISTTTTITVSVIIAAALSAFPIASTSKLDYTKNISNIANPTTFNPHFASHK